MKKKNLFLELISVFFLFYIILDFFNLPSMFGIKISNINPDLFGIVVNSLVVIVLYVITYFEIDKRQVKKDENSQNLTYSLLLKTYISCLNTVNLLKNKTVLRKYIISQIDFDKLENENSVYTSLKNSPFDSYNHVLTLAENGYVEGNFINKYLVIKEKYRSYITFCISFFGLDYIELNDELNELKKYISDLKEDLIKELQREIEFIESLLSDERVKL